MVVVIKIALRGARNDVQRKGDGAQSALDAKEWLATRCGRLALGTCWIGGAGSRYGDKE